MRDVEYWLWLANALGPCAANAAQVLAAFPNPRDLASARGSVDLGQWFSPKQRYALEHTHPREFFSHLEESIRKDVRIVSWADEDYPPLLRQIDSPPLVLYYRGDLSAAAAPLVFAMIGARRPSAYGVEAMQYIAQGLARAGVVLVSGLADGLDGEAHQMAIRVGTPTIACLAFGHEHCYPARNRRLKMLIEGQGLVLSEYPPAQDAQKSFFLQRNRLIAGLSRGVCVVEARFASGTFHTVHHALDFNRDVFSVPGDIFSPTSKGTNRLLCEGAVPVTSARDILHFYGLEEQPCEDQNKPERARTPEIPVSPSARKIYRVLTSRPQSLTKICESTGLPPAQAMAALTELELAGLSRQLAGRQFILKGS